MVVIREQKNSNKSKICELVYKMSVAKMMTLWADKENKNNRNHAKYLWKTIHHNHHHVMDNRERFSFQRIYNEKNVNIIMIIIKPNRFLYAMHNNNKPHFGFRQHVIAFRLTTISYAYDILKKKNKDLKRDNVNLMFTTHAVRLSP